MWYCQKSYCLNYYSKMNMNDPCISKDNITYSSSLFLSSLPPSRSKRIEIYLIWSVRLCSSCLNHLKNQSISRSTSFVEDFNAYIYIYIHILGLLHVKCSSNNICRYDNHKCQHHPLPYNHEIYFLLLKILNKNTNYINLLGDDWSVKSLSVPLDLMFHIRYEFYIIWSCG